MAETIITQFDKEELISLISSSIQVAFSNLKLPTQETDEWFDIHQLREYLPDRPARATIYQWIHSRQIPYHKGSKKLRFLKSEIDLWLKSSRQKTSKEILEAADKYIGKNKNGGNK